MGIKASVIVTPAVDGTGSLSAEFKPTAFVPYDKVVADVNATQLQAVPTPEIPYASATAQVIAAAPSYEIPVANIDYLHIAVTAYSDSSGKYQAKYEIVLVADQIAFDLNKSLTEYVEYAEAVAKDVAIGAIADSASLADAPSFLVGRGVIDDVTLADNFAKTLTKANFDVAAVSDTLLGRTILKYLHTNAPVEDLVGVPDGATYQFAKYLSDYPVVLDQLQLDLEKALADTATILDSPALSFATAFADVLGVDDTSTRATTKAAQDDVAVASNLLPFSFDKALSDTYSLAELVGKAITLPQDDSITANEAISISVAVPQADDVFVIDTISPTLDKYFYESVTAATTLSYALGKSLSDTLQVTEAATFAISTALADTLALSDDVTSLVALSKFDSVSTTDDSDIATGKALADAFTMGVQLTLAYAGAKQDSFTVIDSFSTGGSVTLTPVNVVLGDTVAIDVTTSVTSTASTEESISVAFAGLAEDAFVVGDTSSKLTSRPVTDTFPLNDATAAHTTKAASDTFSLVDQISVSLVVLVELADTFNTGDSSYRATGKSLSETVATSDTLQPFTIDKVLNDTALIADLLGVPDGATYQFDKSVPDAVVSVTDTIDSYTMTKALVDTFTMGEDLSYSLATSLSDTFAMASSLSYSLSTDFAHSVTTSDATETAVTKPFSHNAVVADTVAKTTGTSADDSVSLTTALAAATDKDLGADSVSTSTSTTLGTGKGLTSVAATGDFAPYMNTDKSLADNAIMDDLIGVPDGATYQFNKTLGGIAAIVESIAKDVTTSAQENVFVNDTNSIYTSMTSSDAFSTTDSGSVASQNYVDSTYLAEDYVGDYRQF